VTFDFETRYRIMLSRDERYDGVFFTAVISTGVYCRPSCPGRKPKQANVRFYPTAAAAQEAGFRACKRCRPNAAPGSPAWNWRGDVAGRALRLIRDGIVGREGTRGLARRLGFSERHVRRLLLDELGAGPVALARAQRAQTARALIESTSMPLIDVAFAAGFGSVRQFNDTLRMVFAATPTELRRRGEAAREPGPAGAITLRLPYREPLAADELLRFLQVDAIPGVEEVIGGMYRRSLTLPRGNGVVELSPERGSVRCHLRLDDLRDLPAAVARVRRLLDLDADPAAVSEVLESDPLIARLAGVHRGLRLPGSVDGAELAIRAILQQGATARAARALGQELIARFGVPLPEPDGGITHLFPTVDVLADADPATVPGGKARRALLQRIARMLTDDRLVIDNGADVDACLAELQGISALTESTASYIALRAFADPDVFLDGDAGVRDALARLGQPKHPQRIAQLAMRWRPWRSYASVLFWASLGWQPRSR
jgi:AraC family transcriptional regulator, regulatory protein of adaptative response / DNA-3-methyladenine glycosylase II